MKNQDQLFSGRGVTLSKEIDVALYLIYDNHISENCVPVHTNRKISCKLLQKADMWQQKLPTAEKNFTSLIILM